MKDKKSSKRPLIHDGTQQHFLIRAVTLSPEEISLENLLTGD